MHLCTSACVQNCTIAIVVDLCITAIVQLCTSAIVVLTMTKVIAITINRGGQGKTMLSRSLGVLAAQAGLAVLIADMDTQENSTSWRKRRPEEKQLPLVEFTTEKGLADLLDRARVAECDLVLIDTPPGRSTEAAAAVEECDLALVPCNGEIESFEGLPRTARLVRTTGKRAVVVPNWVQPGSQTEERTIRGVAERHGLASAPVALHRYTVHKEASLFGLTATEHEPESKAAAELHALWDWLCAELQLINGALVHKAARHG